MKFQIAYGFAALLGVASPALGIEPPDTAAPIPPQVAPEDAVAPQVEEPRAEAAEQLAPAVKEVAYLGVGGSQVPELLGEHLKLEPGQGVVVRSLDPNGPAAKAGLGHNDVITRFSGEAVGSHDQLRQAVAALKPGAEVDVDYIHQGEAKTAKVTLGVAPAMPGGIAGMEPKPLEQLMLDGMPQDQAKRIRDAIQQNLKAFEGLQGQGPMPQELLQLRMQQMLQGMELQDPQQGGGINLKSSGTVRMLNADGSGVELKSQDGSKEVRLLGPGGNVEWEGPYDTPQDKEAVPPEFRERIESLNIDPDFKGNGLRLRMIPGRPRDNE